MPRLLELDIAEQRQSKTEGCDAQGSPASDASKVLRQRQENVKRAVTDRAIYIGVITAHVPEAIMRLAIIAVVLCVVGCASSPDGTDSRPLVCAEWRIKVDNGSGWTVDVAYDLLVEDS